MATNNTIVLNNSNTEVVCFSNTFVLVLLPMKYGDRLRLARQHKNLTQEQLVNISGVGQGSISKIERGDQDSSKYDVELAYVLDIDPMWLKTGDAKFAPDWVIKADKKFTKKISEKNAEYNTTLGPDIYGHVPLISWVQAGNWEGIIDNYHPGDAEEWRVTTAKVSKNAFALRIVGDSMVNPYGSPSIPPGSVVIVEPNRSPKNGDIVIARLEDSEEATIKKLVIDGNQKFLKPLNPQYPAIPINGNCTICGVAIKLEYDL